MLEPEIFSYLKNDETILEREPLATLAAEGQLSAYMHNGFWRAMDTLKEKNDLTEMWLGGRAPWALWMEP